MKLSPDNQNTLLAIRATLTDNRDDVRRAQNLRRSIANRRHLKPGTGPRIAR
jgi:hypothetical protein